MAKCDEGYLCAVCGQDVASITDSDLYLRYVLGWVDPEVLHAERERHIKCNSALAQFICASEFEPVVCDGPLDKRNLDPKFVAQRESVVTAAWKRLQELAKSDVPIIDYPIRSTRSGKNTN